MKALILCAGYATRLYPLTKDQPKHLLPIAGKPMLSYAIEQLDKSPEITGIYLVTNKKFYGNFKSWISNLKLSKPIEVFNDGTDSDETKLGAIGDMKFVLHNAKINDDLFVMAGDNLTELKIQEFIDFFKKMKCVIAVRDVKDKELIKKYSEVKVDQSKKVLEFIEKPQNPVTTLAAICMYIFPKEELSFIDKYIKAGNNPDQPGRYIQWLAKERNVYAYVFDEPWFDIGDIHQLNEADEFYKRRVKGLKG